MTPPSDRDAARDPAVDLSDAEERDVDELSPPRAAVVFETVRREGRGELDRPFVSLAASGLAAGLSTSLSLVGQGLLQTMLPDAPWRPLVASFGYSLGFVVAILGRQQLFTENTVTAVLPLLGAFEVGNLRAVLRLWGVVLVANLIGCAAFAYAAARAPIFDEATRRAFLEIGLRAASPGAGELFARGVFAGWLIALTVWILPGAGRARLPAIVLMTYFVGLGAFSHVVAGSTEVLYAVAAGKVELARYFTAYLPPVLAGNVLGGVALVSLLNYGQVVAESE